MHGIDIGQVQSLTNRDKEISEQIKKLMLEKSQIETMLKAIGQFNGKSLTIDTITPKKPDFDPMDDKGMEVLSKMIDLPAFDEKNVAAALRMVYGDEKITDFRGYTFIAKWKEHRLVVRHGFMWQITDSGKERINGTTKTT